MPPSHGDLSVLRWLLPTAIFAAVVSFVAAVARQSEEPTAVKLAAAVLAGLLTLSFTALLEALFHPSYLWIVGLSGALGYAGADYIARRLWRLIRNTGA